MTAKLFFSFLQDWLVETLREHMKYFRRNRSDTQSTTERSTTPTKVSKPQMPHVTFFSHKADCTVEDEASHSRHVKLLSLEWKKTKPNKHAIHELMAWTYTTRRQRFVTSPPTLECLLKTYPLLQQYSEVCTVIYFRCFA